MSPAPNGSCTEEPDRSCGSRAVDPWAWSEVELSRWLAYRCLPSEIPKAFEVHLVNGLLAEDLNGDDLAAMGITDALHQRRVILELRQLFGGSMSRSCSRTLRADISSTACSPLPAAPPTRPAAPPTKCPRPRPQSARLHSEHMSTASLATRTPVKIELPGVPRPEKLAATGSASRETSPYLNAVPRKPRPPSARLGGSRARDQERVVGNSSASCAHLPSEADLSSASASAHQQSPLPRAELPDSLGTHAVSSRMAPTARSEPSQQRSAPHALAPLSRSHSAIVHELQACDSERDLLVSKQMSNEQTGSEVGLASSTSSCTERRSAAPMVAQHASSAAAAAAQESHRSAGIAQGRGTGEGGPCTDIDAARQLEEMQSLALGGHASVSNLLYERDCLAAALAAEKRRSVEFEKLWRHAEQQLRDLQRSEREHDDDDSLAASLAAEKRRSGEFEQLWRHTEQKLYEFCSSETSLLTERLSKAGFQCDGLLPLHAPCPATTLPATGASSSASSCTRAEDTVPCGSPDGRSLHVPQCPTLLGGCRGNLGTSGTGTQASPVVEPRQQMQAESNTQTSTANAAPVPLQDQELTPYMQAAALHLASTTPPVVAAPGPSQTVEPAAQADPEPQPLLTWLKEPVSPQRRVHSEEAQAVAASQSRQTGETRRSANSAQRLLMEQWEEYGGGACLPAFLLEADVEMPEQSGGRTTCAVAVQPARTASTLSRNDNGTVNSNAVCLENLREQFRLEVRDMIKAGTAGPPFLGPEICAKVQQHCTMVHQQRGASGKAGQDGQGLANELPQLVPAM